VTVPVIFQRTETARAAPIKVVRPFATDAAKRDAVRVNMFLDWFRQVDDRSILVDDLSMVANQCVRYPDL
jgi:hypothetical protein